MTDAEHASPVRLAVVGASQGAICGVRDYARVLGEAGGGGEARPSIWWARDRTMPFARFLCEAVAESRRLRRTLAQHPSDAVLWHYSVFSLAYRGVPLAVPLFSNTLRRSGTPVVTMLHEYAYPWGRHGQRGASWAASQRIVLRFVAAVSRGLIVTMEGRARWLESRRWLPARPILVSPVLPTLPTSAELRSGASTDGEVSLLGYAPSDVDVDLVLDAITRLRARGRSTSLRLIGSPGPDSAIGKEWQDAAGRHGCREALRFTGVLSAEQAGGAVAGARLILVALRAGPSSRKTTLANALAAGRAVIATDGPETWTALVEQKAVRLVSPIASAVAAAIGELEDDAASRVELGARARAFAEGHLDAGLEAQRILAFVRSCATAVGRTAE